MGALPEGKRFGSDYQPSCLSRTSYAWMRKLLSEATHDPGSGAKTHRDAIARHLIDVATHWEIQVRGKDYKVASARDSVAAAALLYQYDMGRPPMGAGEMRLAVANHLQTVAKAAADTILAALGNRKDKLSPEEIADFLRRVAVDTRVHLRQADAELAESDPDRAEPDEPPELPAIAEKED
jgi:hypothetical protein